MKISDLGEARDLDGRRGRRGEMLAEIGRDGHCQVTFGDLGWSYEVDTDLPHNAVLRDAIITAINADLERIEAELVALGVVLDEPPVEPDGDDGESEEAA